MEHEENIRLLLSMQEHPDQYSDEQLQQMLIDIPELAGLLEALALTKQAFVKREADEEAAPIDDEWGKFYAAHAAEIDTTDSAELKKPLVMRLMSYVPYKFAASFIGILFTVGVTFATVQIMRMSDSSRQQTVQTEPSASALPDKVIPTDTLKTDTAATVQPIVFDNISMEKMMPQIAAYYKKEVEFINSDARLLCFYFVWKPEEGLDVTLHRLNLFDCVNVELKDSKIVVK